MPRVSLQNLSRASGSDADSLFSQLRILMADLESQLNKYPNTNSRTDLKVPQGTRNRDIFVNVVNGVMRVGVYDGRKIRYLKVNDLQQLQNIQTNFVGLKVGTSLVGAAVTRTTYFPNDKDWGFYKDTTGGTFSLFFNDNGTTQSVNM